jgi:hypothetical protein
MIQYTLIKFLNTWVDFQGGGAVLPKRGGAGGPVPPCTPSLILTDEDRAWGYV